MLESRRANFRIHPAYTRGRLYESRCRDCCCVVMLLVILVAFGVFISCRPVNIREAIPHDHTGDALKRTVKLTKSALQNQQIQKGKNIILPMALSALVISFVYLQLLKAFTQCMLYISVFGVSILLFGLAMIRYTLRDFFTGTLIIGVFALYLASIYCYLRHQYGSAIIMIRLTSQFLSDSMSLLFVPILFGLIGLGLAIMAAQPFSSNFVSEHELSVLVKRALAGIWFAVFFTCLLYYMMAYLVANRVIDWFYMRPSGCCPGLGHMLRNHMGTITFAALLIPFVKILRLFVKCCIGDPNSGCVRVWQPLLRSQIEYLHSLVYTLNDLAIMLATETGHDFIDSASTTGIVVLQNFELFATLECLGLFMSISGVIISAALPTIISLILANNAGLWDRMNLIWITVVAVSIVISILVLCVFSQALLSIYLIYCFEKQLHLFGMGSPDFMTRDPTISRECLAAGDLSEYKPIMLLNAAMQHDGRMIYRPLVIDPILYQSRQVAVPEQAELMPPSHHPSHIIRSNIIQSRVLSHMSRNLLTSRQQNFQGVNYPSMHSMQYPYSRPVQI